MGEITDLIQSYRECVRHVWNSHFHDLPGSLHEFGDVEDALLYGIVLAQTDEYKNWTEEWLVNLCYPSIRVVPRPEPKGIQGMWAREQKGGNWPWENFQVTEEKFILAFIGFSDWLVDGLLDYEYIRCRILQSDEYPDLIGADLLLPAHEVTVYYDISIEQSGPDYTHVEGRRR